VSDATPPSQPSEASRYATFSGCGQPLAVELESLLGVVAPAQLEPLPHSAQWLLGVAAWRGRAVTVVDLAGLVGEPPTATAKWLLLQWQQQCVALAVSTVGAIIAASRCQPPSSHSLPAALAELCQPWWVEDRGSRTACLSVAALYQTFAVQPAFTALRLRPTTTPAAK